MFCARAPLLFVPTMMTMTLILPRQAERVDLATMTAQIEGVKILNPAATNTAHV